MIAHGERTESVFALDGEGDRLEVHLVDTYGDRHLIALHTAPYGVGVHFEEWLLRGVPTCPPTWVAPYRSGPRGGTIYALAEGARKPEPGDPAPWAHPRDSAGWCAAMVALRASFAAPLVEAEPIPGLLYCPGCKTRHVDESEWRTRPHRTHLCSACGRTWRLQTYVYGA